MFENNLTYILRGIFTTIEYTLAAVLCGCLISIPIYFIINSKYPILNLIARIYIAIIKNTPVALQLSVWYFILPHVIDHKISLFIIGTITFGINFSASIAEIIRIGITNIDQGQVEAAKVIGLTERDTFFDIILPQIISNISPLIVNEIMSLIKAIPIIGIIGVTDLVHRAHLISEKYDQSWPILVAGLSYYLLIISIDWLHSFVIRSRAKNNQEIKM